MLNNTKCFPQRFQLSRNIDAPQNQQETFIPISFVYWWMWVQQNTLTLAEDIKGMKTEIIYYRNVSMKPRVYSVIQIATI